MDVKVKVRHACRLCGSPRLELVIPLAPTPVAEKYVTEAELHQATPVYPLDLHQCLDCGHVQLLHVVDPAFLFEDFSYVSANTKPLVLHFEDCAERTAARYGLKAGDLAVDVGSNDGSLLRCYQKRGLRVLGVDPAREIARQATAAGIPTLPEFMTPELAARIRKEHGAAAVVSAFNVYAHADDLAGMTDSIRALLDARGVFVFEFSYLLDILDKMLLGTIFHEHLSHHSVIPMQSFLARHGMQLIDVQRNEIQGGSVIGTAQLAGGPYPVLPSVEESVDLERRRGLDRPDTIRQFSTRLAKIRADLQSLVKREQAAGRRFWGFGAARSGTTLIAQFGLGKVIEKIVDDSPGKQNKFNPGDHIPILPTKALYEQKPEYAFILAWVHAARIIENNKAYLEQGGKFIVCFPELQVISKDGVNKA